MKTIEHRIVDLIAERLRQHMVCNAMALINSDTETPTFDAENIAVSGAYTGAIPREFRLVFSMAGTLAIQETTLFADMGTDQPTPFFDLSAYEIGEAIEIDSTGISVSINSEIASETEYLIRMGNASVSVPEIVLHPVNFYDLQAPSISVFYSGDSTQNQTVAQTRATLELSVVLCVSPEMMKEGIHLEVLGDIRDCINRDPHLWDGSACLSDDIAFTGSNYFDQVDRGNSYFVATAQIVYRSQTKNSRMK